ncbi:helix-turn-helix domain-containing protein [Bartonella sp. DGB2]|uniref:helix-turn-helix domain-containing protein n=1 Tax=Bartonella sp. DGB2 TaxID=3388426 RepID=UPI00398F9011
MQTPTIDKISKKLIGRRWTPEMHRYAEMAENARLGTVKRWKLEEMARKLIFSDVKRSAVYHLESLIRMVPTKQFRGGQRLPIISVNEMKLSSRLNLEEDTVRRLLSYLFQNGLIVIRNSYYCRDDEFDYPIEYYPRVFDIDFRILVARYKELTEMIKKKMEEYSKYSDASQKYESSIRSFRRIYKVMESDLFGHFLIRRIKRIRGIVGRPSKATRAKLEQATKLIRQLLKRWKNYTRHSLKA